MPPLPADSIHARACKLKCEKILTRPNKLLGICLKICVKRYHVKKIREGQLTICFLSYYNIRRITLNMG